VCKDNSNNTVADSLCVANVGPKPATTSTAGCCGMFETMQTVWTPVSGVGYTWHNTTTGTCPAGAINGLIDDDNDSRHSISEEDNPQNLAQQRICFTGVPAEAGVEFRWTTSKHTHNTVQNGWFAIDLYDDLDSYHNNREQDGCTGNCEAQQLQVRASHPDYSAQVSRYGNGCDTLGQTCPNGGIAFLRADNSDYNLHSDENDDEHSYGFVVRRATEQCVPISFWP